MAIEDNYPMDDQDAALRIAKQQLADRPSGLGREITKEQNTPPQYQRPAFQPAPNTVGEYEEGPNLAERFGNVFDQDSWKNISRGNVQNYSNQLYDRAANWLTAPGNIYSGKMDPNSPEARQAAAWFSNMPLSSLPLAGEYNPNVVFSGGKDSPNLSRRALFGLKEKTPDIELNQPSSANLPSTIENADPKLVEGAINKMLQAPQNRREAIQTMNAAVSAARHAPEMLESLKEIPKPEPEIDPKILDKAYNSLRDYWASDASDETSSDLLNRSSPKKISQKAQDDIEYLNEELMEQYGRQLKNFEITDPNFAQNHFKMNKKQQDQFLNNHKQELKNNLEKEIGQELPQKDFEKLYNESFEKERKVHENSDYFMEKFEDPFNSRIESWKDFVQNVAEGHAKKTGENYAKGRTDFITPESIAEHEYDVAPADTKDFLESDYFHPYEQKHASIRKYLDDLSEVLQNHKGSLEDAIKQGWEEGLKKHYDFKKSVKEIEDAAKGPAQHAGGGRVNKAIGGPLAPDLATGSSQNDPIDPSAKTTVPTNPGITTESGGGGGSGDGGGPGGGGSQAGGGGRDSNNADSTGTTGGNAGETAGGGGEENRGGRVSKSAKTSDTTIQRALKLSNHGSPLSDAMRIARQQRGRPINS